MQDEIIINGVKYVPETTVNKFVPTGNRAVVVIDRGWIFAGDIEDLSDNSIRLNNAVWVFRWEEVGFNGVIDDPKNSKVHLRVMNNPVEVPKGSVIFRVPVCDNWGL